MLEKDKNAGFLFANTIAKNRDFPPKVYKLALTAIEPSLADSSVRNFALSLAARLNQHLGKNSKAKKMENPNERRISDLEKQLKEI